MTSTSFNINDPNIHTGYYDKNSASSLSNAVESMFADLPANMGFNIVMKYSNAKYYCCGMKISNDYGCVLHSAYFGGYPLRYSAVNSGTWTHKIVSLGNL